MSITDTVRLIMLMDEMSEKVGEWSTRTNDSVGQVEDLKRENIEVHHQTDTTLKRAIAIEEADRDTTRKVLDTSEWLYKQCEEMMVVIDKLPDEANRKLNTAQTNYNRWRDYHNKAKDWYEIARQQLERAISEYNIAIDDYNRALNRYNSAVDQYNSCCQRQTRDKDGRLSHTCNSESSQMDRARANLRNAETILSQKEEIKNMADIQKNAASNALSISNSAFPQTKQCLELAKDAVDLANIAYRSCCDAVSASRSACNLARKGVDLNQTQHEYNEESVIQYKKADENLRIMLNSATKMITLSESCNVLNSLLNSEIEYKQGVLNMMSSIEFDINVFNVEN